jgi:T5SS/PEP-CTERM-associated repeat protein
MHGSSFGCAQDRRRRGYTANSIRHLTTLLTLFVLLSAPARAQFSDDNETIVISGVVSNWVDTGFVIGSNFVFDALQIDTGGVLSNGFGYIGYEVGADNNAATVTDAGSVWTNANDLIVGLSGAGNQLVITDGGMVFNTVGVVGNDSTSGNNNVLVTGAGSIWTNGDDLTVGLSGGANQLVISDGGQVFNSVGTVGNDSISRDNSVQVTGPGSTWNNGSDLVVGSDGPANQLVISEGGLVMNNLGTVSASASSSNNTVLVTGPGSFWRNGDDLAVGYWGRGNQLTISNGGLVTNDYGFVGGSESSSNNAVVVTGPGSLWESGSNLYIGYSGKSNQLTISNGGAVLNFAGWIGRFSSKNRVLVTGTDSAWNNVDNLTIGDGGDGNSLVISNRGVVYNNSAYVGFSSGSSNSVLVTGPSSVWSCDSSLVIGYQGGSNQLVVSNGGQVANSYGYVGYFSSSNSVQVTGPGSVWTNTQPLLIGYQGPGNQLVITNGGEVINTDAYLGFFASSSNNNAVVGGPGSSWNNNGVLDVRQGTVTINGGMLTALALQLINGAKSVFSFPSGVLNSGGTTVINGQQFAVGNGFFTATFHLMGGLHSFNNGLRIRTNSFLTGCGTITGTVLMEGTLLADCGGTLTFSGSFTNNATTIATNGTTINFLGPVVNNGTINALNGAVKFFSTFQNNGTLLTVDTNRWINGSNGKWETGSNWSAGAPFINQPALLITNAASKTVTIDAITANSASTMTISNLTLSAPSGSTNTLSLNNVGTLTPLSIRNSLVIGSNAAVVVNRSAIQISSNVFLGNGLNSTLTITNGGSFAVTNALGNGRLLLGQAGQGTLTMNGGTVTVDLLVVTNNASRVVFNTGLVNSKGTAVTNGIIFAVGDGANAATFHLLGGVHSFNNGLRIRNNASLTGCGTINGVVVVDAGGTALTDCGGSLTFGGSVTNNGTLRAVNGSVLEAYGPVVNNGLIDAINGRTNFHAGFINNGTVITSNSIPLIVSVTTSGSDVRISFTTGSTASYVVEYNTDLSTGSWNTLTNITGTGSTMTATDSGAALLPRRFYRVRLVVP